MSKINGTAGAAFIGGHDFLYGTAECEVCHKEFELGKWQKNKICIPCKVDKKINKDKHTCKKCGWEGTIMQMKYEPPTKESSDFAYNSCPKCSNKLKRSYCGETDDWWYA